MVLNPSPVPIRLNEHSIESYVLLANLLRNAATQAEDAASIAAPARAFLLRGVRDSLRQAAQEALVPRGGTRRPRCARCGIDCVNCSPTDGDDSNAG